VLNTKYNFILALFWTAIVAYLSLASVDTSFSNPIKIPYKDKMIHFVFYFLFVILWNKAINRSPFSLKKNLQILIIAIIYGIILEFLQHFCTQKRTGDFFDAVANSLGALMGFVILFRKNKIDTFKT
jgi:VanZ family protein